MLRTQPWAVKTKKLFSKNFFKSSLFPEKRFPHPFLTQLRYHSIRLIQGASNVFSAFFLVFLIFFLYGGDSGRRPTGRGCLLRAVALPDEPVSRQRNGHRAVQQQQDNSTNRQR